MKKNLIFVTFWLSFSHIALSQVIITPIVQPNGYFNLNNLWKVTINNSLPTALDAQLTVTIEDGKGQVVVTGQSPVFNIKQGVSRPFWTSGQPYLRYGNSTSTGFVRSRGMLPTGNYTVCYQLLEANTAKNLGNLCQEERIMPSSPPELISPLNGENIYTYFPLLTWKSPFPIDPEFVTYSLRLAEIKANQGPLEALEQNIPLLLLTNLRSTILPYPAGTKKLVEGVKYVWQVSAKSGDFDLGKTEIWTFEIAAQAEATSMPPPSTTHFKSFHELKLAPSGNYKPISKILRFLYPNPWGATAMVGQNPNNEQVSFKIYPAGKQASPITLNPTLPLIVGNNKLSINLQGVAGITAGSHYVLVVTDALSKEFFVEFKYGN